MAIIFELVVECETKEQAEKQFSHFEGLTFTLLSGLKVSLQTSIQQTDSGTSTLEVSSPQLNGWGVCTVQDAVDMSECGVRLYHHLLSAPDFQFAYIGFNPSICVAELGDYLSLSSDGYRSCSFSCVLDDKVAQKFEPLGFFQPFRPGYVWNGYVGEAYHPLFSNAHPELLRLKRQLLTV